MLADIDTTSSTLLDDLVEVQRLNAQSMHHPHLAAAVAAMSAAVARDTVVSAVSREGERLLGALLLSLPGVRCWQPGDVSVILIDGYVAGGAGIQDVALRMRRMGTQVIRAVVLGHIGSPLAGVDVDVQVAPSRSLAAVATT